MTLLVFLALQASAPQPAELRTFQDWIVGCDNGRACQAVALVTYADGDPGLTMSLRREAEADAEPVLWINHSEARGGALEADGERLPARLVAAGESVIVHPADTPAVIGTLRRARRLRLLDAAGAELGPISVSGASAAMLYMDEAQRRLDKTTALVRRGERPASAVPAPPTLPEVRLAPPAEDAALTFEPAEIEALRREAGCTLEEVGGPDLHDAVALETGKTLLLLACGSGAYNLTYLPYVAQRRGGRAEFSAAPFDRQWAMDEQGRPALINAEWDSARRLLSEFYRGRGLGDCGTRASYGWDGVSFRLVHREEMGECRGAIDFITTWRARVVRR